MGSLCPQHNTVLLLVIPELCWEPGSVPGMVEERQSPFSHDVSIFWKKTDHEQEKKLKHKVISNSGKCSEEENSRFLWEHKGMRNPFLIGWPGSPFWGRGIWAETWRMNKSWLRISPSRASAWGPWPWKRQVQQHVRENSRMYEDLVKSLDEAWWGMRKWQEENLEKEVGINHTYRALMGRGVDFICILFYSPQKDFKRARALFWFTFSEDLSCYHMVMTVGEVRKDEAVSLRVQRRRGYQRYLGV